MARSATRVLVLSRDPEAVSTLAGSLGEAAAVDVCARIQEAVERVASACGALEAYDAILCRAESADQLSFVVRLRKKDPETPIVLVSGRADHPDFRELACRMGATAVLVPDAGTGAVGRAVFRAAEAGRNARRMRSFAGRARRSAEEIRALAVLQRRLLERSLRLARRAEA